MQIYTQSSHNLCIVHNYDLCGPVPAMDAAEHEWHEALQLQVAISSPPCSRPPYHAQHARQYADVLSFMHGTVQKEPCPGTPDMSQPPTIATTQSLQPVTLIYR